MRGINKKQWMRLILLLIMTSVLFWVNKDYTRYENIEDSYDFLDAGGDFSYYNLSYKNVTSAFSIKQDRVDFLFNKIGDKLKYNKICFEDRGTRITDAEFDYPFNISVVYSGNENQILSLDMRSGVNITSKECFKLIDKQNITWHLIFVSPDPMTWSIIEKPVLRDVILDDKVLTYLKVSVWFYLWDIISNFIYAGLFVLAISSILNFIIHGRKKSD